MATPPLRHRLGYTLIELVVALMLAALLVGLAAPALGAQLRRLRMQTALDTLTRDIFHARMAAIRANTRVELRFLEDADECIESYRVVVTADPERLVRHVDVRGLARGLCVRKNGPATVGFSTRGRPGWNLSVWVHSGALRDSLTLNQLGRVQRWP